jgi:hypothetical protein
LASDPVEASAAGSTESGTKATPNNA